MLCMDTGMQDTEMPPTLTHAYYTHGSRELKTQIISEVKVEKMAIEVNVQKHDDCWLWWAGICCPRV